LPLSPAGKEGKIAPAGPKRTGQKKGEEGGSECCLPAGKREGNPFGPLMEGSSPRKERAKKKKKGTLGGLRGEGDGLFK